MRRRRGGDPCSAAGLPAASACSRCCGLAGRVWGWGRLGCAVSCQAGRFARPRERARAVRGRAVWGAGCVAVVTAVYMGGAPGAESARHRGDKCWRDYKVRVGHRGRVCRWPPFWQASNTYAAGCPGPGGRPPCEGRRPPWCSALGYLQLLLGVMMQRAAAHTTAVRCWQRRGASCASAPRECPGAVGAVGTPLVTRLYTLVLAGLVFLGVSGRAAAARAMAGFCVHAARREAGPGASIPWGQGRRGPRGCCGRARFWVRDSSRRASGRPDSALCVASRAGKRHPGLCPAPG